MEVLFDVDGVLVHPWGFRNCLQAEYGISPEMTSSFFQGKFNLCLNGEADLYDALHPFLEGWGWTDSPEALTKIWFEAENLPNNTVLNTAEKLKMSGHSIHIASNQERYRAKYLSEVMGFQDHFDELFFSCHIGACKPESTYFKKIEEALACSKDQILLIDDAIENIDAAQRHGWHGIHFENDKSLSHLNKILNL